MLKQFFRSQENRPLTNQKLKKYNLVKNKNRIGSDKVSTLEEFIALFYRFTGVLLNIHLRIIDAP